MDSKEMQAALDAATARGDKAEGEVAAALKLAEESQAALAVAQEALGAATKRADEAEAALAVASKAAPAKDAVAKDKKAHKASDEPIAYTAPHEVYLDRIYQSGERFVTRNPKGDLWVKVPQAKLDAEAAAEA